MSFFYPIYARIYQGALRFASLFVDFPEPELTEGKGTLLKLPELVQKEGVTNLFLVIYHSFHNSPKYEPLMKAFEERGIKITLFDQVPPDPPIESIEAAAKIYREVDCQGIAAIGGGSPMDLAKAVGARIANPHKSIKQMEGYFKIHGKVPPLFLVPTTGGTGSEATLCAVITDTEAHRKFFLIDRKMVPKHAILDPELTLGLSPSITASTGMDALTHAIESYIGQSNTAKTSKMASTSVVLAFKYLERAFKDGSNLEARAGMQKAAFLGGEAFTRAFLGYVHGITHNLGGFYHVSHGEANAVFLPHVLRYYGKKAWKRLAQLADITGISKPGESTKTKAENFIIAIETLSRSLGMPERLPNIVKEEDLPIIVDRAFHESNPVAPVPRFMGRKELEETIRALT